ncbi:MAG: bifunctional 3-deoxy-7-phosphoheptulonate synthase/chorismate mutase type II [Chitinophagales bacterium]
MSNLKIAPLSDWGFGFERPVIISGPCSAETKDQLMTTALGLADKGIDILRAGIWKPRTRPNTFEGMGREALPWLIEAGKAIGKPVSVEVANKDHVFECLKAGVDILWIGARTTVNPFAVQEIADAVSGTDIPVIIKNPINPDLSLWMGAIERFNFVGLTKLAALHRGFSSYEKTQYRNQPKWEIPVELKRLEPGLPIFCDPSHICGNTELLESVSQKALDLDFDGLMLESHCNPAEAWSDASQQITPERLGEILGNLVIRSHHAPGELSNALSELRGNIDRIDNYLLELLSERMEIAQRIGQYKKENDVTILQTSRWDEIVQDRVKKGASKDLTDTFVKAMFEAIHQESIRKQTKVMNTKGEELAK